MNIQGLNLDGVMNKPRRSHDAIGESPNKTFRASSVRRLRNEMRILMSIKKTNGLLDHKSLLVGVNSRS
jgi:hypothetical protein